MTYNNTLPSRYQPRSFEMVLDFCVELSRRMIMSGANVERVNLAVDRVCSTYELDNVSIFLLPTYVSVSARDRSGYSAVRQASIPAGGINLTRLMSLNRLSYRVKEQHPSPDRLGSLLEKASDTKDYPDPVVLLGQICAMSCLCLLFGGGFREILCVAAVTVLAHYLLILLAIPGVDKMLTNALLMWIVTSAVFLLSSAGITDKQPVVIITVLMLVIPGIPLTNAVRSMLCGNELSGGMQTVRVTVETMALATGIFLSMVMFSSADLLNNPVETISNPFILILLAFGTSFFLGVVFRILPRDLWLAGLGGAITRIVLLILTPLCARPVYATVAAFVASIYAELLGKVQKKPSTYYTYPAIIPLIPGDLFFYTLIGINQKNSEMVRTNGFDCALTGVLSIFKHRFCAGSRSATFRSPVRASHRL